MKEYICKECGEVFTDAELKEFREMGEAHHREKGCFFCPDCWDSFRRLTLEEQAAALLK